MVMDDEPVVLITHTRAHVVAWTFGDCQTARARCTTENCEWNYRCRECEHLHPGEPCADCKDWGGPCA